MNYYTLKAHYFLLCCDCCFLKYFLRHNRKQVCCSVSIYQTDCWDSVLTFDVIECSLWDNFSVDFHTFLSSSLAKSFSLSFLFFTLFTVVSSVIISYPDSWLLHLNHSSMVSLSIFSPLSAEFDNVTSCECSISSSATSSEVLSSQMFRVFSYHLEINFFLLFPWSWCISFLQSHKLCPKLWNS